MFFCRKVLNCSSASFSATFDRTGRSEIGLLLFGSSWSPSLRCGTTSAFFHARGNVELARDRLMIRVIQCGMWGRQSLITEMVILSCPGALLLGIAGMALLTSAQRQGLEIKEVAIWDRT